MEEKKKFLSQNGISHIWLLLKQYFNQKVDKVDGKQLSTNDFTDEYKNKIDNAGSGDYADITGKPQINEYELKSGNNTLEELGIVIPDTSNFITEETLVSKNYATETFVNSKISSVYKPQGSVETYNDLEEKKSTAQIGDVWDVKDTGMNYSWTGEKWDELGMNIDLTDYIKSADLEEITNEEIDEIIPTIGLG